jgi:hypothetical protein
MSTTVQLFKAAALLNIIRQALWKWIRAGKIQAVKLPSGRYRMPDSEMEVRPTMIRHYLKSDSLNYRRRLNVRASDLWPHPAWAVSSLPVAQALGFLAARSATKRNHFLVALGVIVRLRTKLDLRGVPAHDSGGSSGDRT